MDIQDIHHVAIICSDYARSKAFYTDILGGQILCETYREDRASYKLDVRLGLHSQIELFSFSNPPERLSYPEACGLRHLALKVADIVAVQAELQAKGVETETIRIDDITGKRFFFFQDPDGLPIEMMES